MTTRNISGVVEAQDAFVDIADKARRRAQELQRELATAAQRVDDISIGHRVAQQGMQDHIDELTEEADQLGGAIAGNITPPPPVDEQTPDAPPAQPDDATAQMPAAPAARQPHVMNVRYWSLLQWILAILGILLGLIVARYTWHFLFGDFHGSGRGVGTTLWFIALPALGFFSGGFLGWWFPHRNRN